MPSCAMNRFRFYFDSLVSIKYGVLDFVGVRFTFFPHKNKILYKSKFSLKMCCIAYLTRYNHYYTKAINTNYNKSSFKLTANNLVPRTVMV